MCFHFHFPAGRGHAKIPQGRMLGVVFLLETESRSAAGPSATEEFCSPSSESRGTLEKAAKHPELRGRALPVAHPYAAAAAVPAGAPSPIPRQTALPLRARACTEPGGTGSPRPGPRDLNTRERKPLKGPNLIGGSCCSEGDAGGRSCCCRHSGGRSTVHHGHFRKGTMEATYGRVERFYVTMATCGGFGGVAGITATSHVTSS